MNTPESASRRCTARAASATRARALTGVTKLLVPVGVAVAAVAMTGCSQGESNCDAAELATSPSPSQSHRRQPAQQVKLALVAAPERNRERVVAARVVFAEQGLDASTNEIARGAGVGIATLFRRFPTVTTWSRWPSPTR